MTLSTNDWINRIKPFLILVVCSFLVLSTTKDFKLCLIYFAIMLAMTIVILFVFSGVGENVLFTLQFPLALGMMYHFKFDTNIAKIVGIFFAALAVAYLLHKFNDRISNKMIVICVILLSLILLIFGVGDNGVKTTLAFGPVSIQATEIIRFMTLVLLGRFFDSFDDTTIKIKKVAYFLIILSILFVLMSEKGTLLVIYFATLLTAIFTFYKKESKWILIGLVAVGGFVAIIYILHSFGLLLFFDGQVTTIIERFSGEDPFQITESINAIVEGSLLGKTTPENVISVAAYDFSVAGFIQQFGLIAYLFLLGSSYLFFGFVFTKLTSTGDLTAYPIIFAYVFELTYCVLMNFGYVPIVGINPPFTSCGFTYTLVFYISIFYLLFKIKSEQEA